MDCGRGRGPRGPPWYVHALTSNDDQSACPAAVEHSCIHSRNSRQYFSRHGSRNLRYTGARAYARAPPGSRPSRAGTGGSSSRRARARANTYALRAGAAHTPEATYVSRHTHSHSLQHIQTVPACAPRTAVRTIALPTPMPRSASSPRRAWLDIPQAQPLTCALASLRLPASSGTSARSRQRAAGAGAGGSRDEQQADLVHLEVDGRRRVVGVLGERGARERLDKL